MYTTIKAYCVDQALQVASIPKLASGGENSTCIDVTFDAKWNGYGKTAIFYRSRDKVFQVVMKGDTCVIPREVLAEAGKLYFGIVGVSGAITRTSEVVALIVEQGAITGLSPYEPLPDVYKQVLSAYADVEQKVAVERARVDNLVAGGTVDGSEVADIRVGTDGTTYTSAGEAVRAQFNATTYPKKLNSAAWVQTPLEKQPFLYWDLHNGSTIMEQVEQPASYLCGAGSLADLGSVSSYVMKRGRLINDIALTADVDEYTVLAYTTSAFTGHVYLMHTDFSGTYPYLVANNQSFEPGWNVIRFAGKQKGTVAETELNHGYRFLAVRIYPTAQATTEMVNGLQLALVRNLASVLDAWLAKSRSSASQTTHDIVAWGDSLTQGAGGNGTTYLGVVANEFNATYYNGGQGGESPALIACRAGANTFYIPAGQNPSSSFNGVFEFGGGSLYTSASSASIPVRVNGKSYTLVRDSAGKYSVSGLSDVADYPRPVALDQQYNKGKVTIIWVGTNSGRSYADVYPWVDRIVETLPNKNYLVVGLTYHTDMTLLADTNAQLKTRYGNKFLDIRDCILTNGLARAGVSPTSADQTAIANGVMPPSLLSDDVHFSAAGYTVIGKFIIDKLYALGYDKYLV